MSDQDMYQTGMKIRKEIFGADVVEKRMASVGEFGAPLQKLINQYAYGEIWGREALPRKMRSLLTIAMLVAYAVAREWAGVECLSGIPGTIGATPIQNVGAYGQEVSETIVRVETLDRTTGRTVWFTNWECRFGYRSSLFKNHQRERYVILSVTFRLRPGGEAAARYPELRQYVEDASIDAHDLRAVRQAVIAIRKRKGMVLDPTDPDTRSDGSFFMNPVIPLERLDPFLTTARNVSGDAKIPHFPSAGEVKLSAAWLIEHAGFQKGYVHGNVGLSTKHTLAVINHGGGTAAEVLELVTMIQDKVQDTFGIEIHPEPTMVGIEVSSAE